MEKVSFKRYTILKMEETKSSPFQEFLEKEAKEMCKQKRGKNAQSQWQLKDQLSQKGCGKLPPAESLRGDKTEWSIHVDLVSEEDGVWEEQFLPDAG